MLHHLLVTIDNLVTTPSLLASPSGLPLNDQKYTSTSSATPQKCRHLVQTSHPSHCLTLLASMFCAIFVAVKSVTVLLQLLFHLSLGLALRQIHLCMKFYLHFHKLAKHHSDLYGLKQLNPMLPIQ